MTINGRKVHLLGDKEVDAIVIQDFTRDEILDAVAKRHPDEKLGNETVYDKLRAYIQHIVRH